MRGDFLVTRAEDLAGVLRCSLAFCFKTLLVEFIDLIRPDRRFDTVEDLVAQMKLDCAEAERRLDAADQSTMLAAFPLAQAQKAGTL